jgi:hypothetical protein
MYPQEQGTQTTSSPRTTHEKRQIHNQE